MRKADLVTETGRHPAVVLPPTTTAATVAALVLDLVALLIIGGLVALGRVSPEAGLPWIALLLGVKAAGARRRGNGHGSAVTTLLGF